LSPTAEWAAEVATLMEAIIPPPDTPVRCSCV
jgi:hypothetical protein